MSRCNDSPYVQYYEKYCDACCSHKEDEDRIIECLASKEDILKCMKLRKFMIKNR